MIEQIYTSHWRNSELGDVDAVIVSISRGEPRFRLPFRYRRLRALAPGNEAWNTKTRKEFEAAYLAQLEEIGAAAILSDLERIAGNHACVLLCWEKLANPDEWCHRRMLAAYIKREAGIVVPELEPGHLPRRPDVPQLSLFDGEERG